MSVNKNLQDLRLRLKPGVRLVAVSKTMPVNMLREAYEAGQRHFGENKVQEIIRKQPEMPADVQWHFIGHLQTNKVKFITPFVQLIESVDSLKLLKEINRQAAHNNRIINCLLQFYIADEETKFGLDEAEAQQLLETLRAEKLNQVAIVGVMGMASFTDNREQIRGEFRRLKAIFDWLKSEWFPADDRFKEISMGMSGDFDIAMEEGATNVRIGSGIFGLRV